MANMEIVTGSTGIAHVTPIDDAVRNTNTGKYNQCLVFSVFDSFAAEVKTDTRIEISGGYGMIQGRYFKIAKSDKVSVEIESGQNNIKRLDIICARYTLENSVENVSLVVVKGEGGEDYTAPTAQLHTTGNVNEGATVYDFPLYYVYKNGVYIDHIEAQFIPVPDGGRLGEIEAAFATLQANFTALEQEMSSIPSEVAQAASKSYVDGKVAEKAPSFHRYDAQTVENGTASSVKGTGNYYGHVKLSDKSDYSSGTPKAASDGVAVTEKALSDALAALGTQVTYSLSGTTLTITTK